MDNLSFFKHSQTPSSGWIVYLAESLANLLPKLPRGIDLRPFEKRGVFLIAADKSFPRVPPTNLKSVQALGKIVASWAKGMS